MPGEEKIAAAATENNLGTQIQGLMGTIISAGGSLLTGRWNRKAQREQNEMDRQHEINMYNQQKQDSLDFWNMQNAYNHPLQQMERLRQAGLNPHLVYGKGADNTAMAISTPKPTPSSKNAPMLDPGLMGRAFESLGTGAVMLNADLKQKAAQTDNLHQDLINKQKDATLKDLQAATEAQNQAKNDYQHKLAMELYDSIVQKAKNEVELQKINMDTQRQNLALSLDKNEREKLESAANIRATYQKILESKVNILEKSAHTDLEKQQLLNAKTTLEILKWNQDIKSLDYKIKQKDLELRQRGFHPSMSAWQVLLNDYIDQQAQE